MKIRNTFLKMILVSTMVNLMFFAMNTRENGLYYGENGSSRFSNRLYYGENDKKRVFSRFFESQKKQKTRPQELKSVSELIEDPLYARKHFEIVYITRAGKFVLKSRFFPRTVTFDLRVVQTRATRRLKAETLYFPTLKCIK